MTPKKLKPCGRCSACDEVTFLGLSGRVLDVDSDDDNVSVAEDVLAAMAGRHPFGIAVRLGEVLAELELFEAEGRAARGRWVEHAGSCPKCGGSECGLCANVACDCGLTEALDAAKGATT